MATAVARVADTLAIPASNTCFTQAMSMQGANAVQVSFILITLGGSSGLTPTLEGSNDMTNWSLVTSYSAISTAGFQVPSASTQIAWQYVRLKLAAGSGGTIIVTADISTADL